MKVTKRLVCILPCGSEVLHVAKEDGEPGLAPDGRPYAKEYFCVSHLAGPDFRRFAKDCDTRRCPCLHLLRKMFKDSAWSREHVDGMEIPATATEADLAKLGIPAGDVRDLYDEIQHARAPVEEVETLPAEIDAKYRVPLRKRLAKALRQPGPFEGYFCALAEEGEKYVHAPDSATTLPAAPTSNPSHPATK